MKTLKLKKDWLYDPDNSKFRDGDGAFSLALINRKEGVVKVRDTSDEELHEKYNHFPWKKCREQFNLCWNEKSTSLIYCHEGNLSESIGEFISKFETKLGLKELSQFYRTSYITMTAIKVSPFWVECPIRRQLFTVLLRAGRNYQLGADIQTALDSTQYTQQLKSCIDLFLAGYHNFDQASKSYLEANFHNGIIWRFKNKTVEEILAAGMMTK